MSTLSVCMITKNEENNIYRCLKSVEKLADEIIILDTGSTDNTLNIARSFPKVKIYNYIWNNDFSAARNESLSHATKKWVFFIDADEELVKEDIPILKKFMKKEKKEALGFRLINIIDGIEHNNIYTVRFFKKRSSYKFEGKIHEQITPSIYKRNGPDCITNTNIRILHYGYDGNIVNIDSKIDRNLDILHSFDDFDKDGFYYYNLATEYFRKQDNESAIKYYTLAEDTPSMIQNYKLNLSINKARCYEFLGEYDMAIDHLEKYIKLTPDYRELYFYCAIYYNNLKKYDKAYSSIIQYKNTPIGEYPDSYLDKTYNVDDLILEFRCLMSKDI